MTPSKDKCLSDNCDKQAPTLQCPTCIKLGIPGSFFCSQECFKENWSSHKDVHKKAREAEAVASATDMLASLGKLGSKRHEDGLQLYYDGYTFTGPLRPYKQSATRTVPPHIRRPDYADHPEGRSISEEEDRARHEILVLKEEQIEGVRLASKLARECLDEVAKAVAPGVTTDELDRICHEAAVERECYPSPLNYYKFPKSCCTSVNEVICHGIPDFRPLVDGDLCNVDITVYHRGYHGDLNETMFVGKVDEESKRLVKCAYECLQEGISIVKPGAKYRDIGNVIQKHAQSYGYSVVKRYTGHGIHSLFHCAPTVPHYAKNKAPGIMKVGHIFTIEPMINVGSWRDSTWPDDWTSVTVDGRRSAQFEQTMVVTETGCDILTRRRAKDGKPYFMD